METLQTWGCALLDFAYPPHCAVCEADIEASALLCGSCWAEIVPRRPHSRVEDGGRAFEKIVALGPFTGALQQAIYALKFRNQVRLGRALGERMGQCLAGQLAPLDCLLPVPLHPARLRERGFNQSAEIAAGLGGRARRARVLRGRAAAEKHSAADPFVGRGTPRQSSRCLCTRGCAARQRSDRDSR